MSKTRKTSIPQLLILSVIFLLLISFSKTVSANYAPSVKPASATSTLSLILTPTPTVDPSTIGDTTGVILVGSLVVFIILAGVLWGGILYQRESNEDDKS